MEIFVKLVVSLLKFLLAMCDMGEAPDKYIQIRPKPLDEKNVVPFARTDVPRLGDDHEQLIKQAEILYPDDDNRYKWLMAIHRLRNMPVGWAMDKARENRLAPRWGLTHSAS